MYTINEGQLTTPDQWKNDTVHVLTFGTGKEPGFSLMMTRDEIAEGMVFSDYVKVGVINIFSNLPGFGVFQASCRLKL